MKAILADPTIKNEMVPISPTSRQNQLIRHMWRPCSRCIQYAS